jgi:hypothetical protein
MFLDSKTVKKLPKGGHEANIKNFAVDPLCEFIATIGCDGTLIVSAIKDEVIVAKVPKVAKQTQLNSS